MFKKSLWFTIVATLVAWMLFWEVKETITGERTFFVYRWLFSDLDYAKDIEVKTYLLTNEQVSHVFAHPDEEIQQPRKPALESKNVNLVIRLRDLKGGAISGKLRWKMFGPGGAPIDVIKMSTSKNAHKYTTIVLPLGIVVIEREDALPEPITVEWEELYVWR